MNALIEQLDSVMPTAINGSAVRTAGSPVRLRPGSRLARGARAGQQDGCGGSVVCRCHYRYRCRYRYSRPRVRQRARRPDMALATARFRRAGGRHEG